MTVPSFIDPAISLAKLYSGRSILLSYPKSGRTWILNVFLNYWWRASKGSQEPLPFHKNFRSEQGKHFEQETGISFSHGAKLGHLRKGAGITVRESDLRMLPVSLLVRNPMSVLVSYYHHLNRGKRSTKSYESLHDFITSPGGIDAYAQYHNYVIPKLLENNRACIVLYENLHQTNPDREKEFQRLFSTHFKDVDHSALSWAITKCDPESLRARADPLQKRIRQAKTVAKDPELTQELQDLISDEINKKLSGVARDKILGSHAI